MIGTHHRDKATLVGQMQGIKTKQLTAAGHRRCHRDRRLLEGQLNATVLGQLLQGTAEAAAGEVAQAMHLHPGRQKAGHRRPERGTVGLDRGLQVELIAGRRNRQAMAAQITAHQHLITGLDRQRIHGQCRLDQADAAGGHKETIALAALHHLGITRGDRDPAGPGRRSHRGQHPPQQLQGQPLLKDQGDAQVQGPSCRHRQIIGRADDRELADVATGEFQWMHHIAIGAEGQPTMGQLQAGGVVEHPVWIVIEPVDFALNQLLHQGAATAMAKQNPFDAIGGPAHGL